jgi:hypothetical protein
MENEVVLPPTETVQADTPAVVAEVVAVEPELNEDGTPKEVKAEVKPEKTAAEKELIRIQRGIDRKTRQNAELKAKLDLYEQQLTQRGNGVNYQEQAGDSEKLSLTRAELLELATAEANRLAPTLAKQAQRVETDNAVLSRLASEMGKPKFVELLSEVNEVTGGLVDSKGGHTLIAEAILGASNPKQVLEWMADPDNEDEAARLSGLSAFQLGKEFSKLESKLAEKPKPQVSKAPAPIEAIRGQGSTSAAPDPSNTKAWVKWANEQESKARI